MTIEELKQMLAESKSDQVIAAANQLATTSTDRAVMAQAYYLRGNAYRQQGNMRQAMNSYLEAMELEPDGPAAQAYRTIQEILDFYNHDLYNP
ncbi:MAG: tetratricopeptide repeat protein [Muribaculaceae bacterium]|nr:tetratricopeptide repeat protein [Muribaculaceae bacterium]MBR1725591.1 tetratricopeptide repeat protein [Muribaculaceae bacterium]